MFSLLLRSLTVVCVAALAAPVGGQVIWSLGTQDRDYAEFALARDYTNYARKFSQPPELLLPNDDAASQWPWIHPGPVDSWAGSREHTFVIHFDGPRAMHSKAYQLVLDTVAAHYGHPPVLEIDLNGRTSRLVTRATGRDDAALTDPGKGAPRAYRVLFPANVVKQSGNRLSISNVQGSWLLYDRVSFQAASGEIREIEVNVARGLLRGPDDQPCRRLQISFGDGILTEAGTLSAKSALGEVTRPLDPHRDLQEVELLLPVNAVDQPSEVTVTLTVGSKTIRRTVALPAERKWEVHLVHQTHLDIGYTHTQEDVLARQVQSLKDATRYVHETREYPTAARFRFHPEGIWAVDEFMRTAEEDEIAALLVAARHRDIHLDAMYAQAMTGMYNEEELFALMDGAARFGQQHGIPIDSAMQTDVPGYTWGLIPALAHHGVRYLTMGPNAGHRVGHVFHWSDKPFWWEAPSGKQRVLCWLSGAGYSAFHGRPLGHRITPDELFAPLKRLEDQDYPYPLVMLRYNIEGDNGRPNRVLSDVVRDWNKEYVWPQLVLSRNSDVMRELERRYGEELPVVRGDYTPYWEDGCASTSAATSLCRQGCERILQAQALFAMLDPQRYPAKAFDAVWTDLIMYDEHTWGAHCSISQPDDPFTLHQDKFKQAYAQRGYQGANALVEQATAARKATNTQSVDVFNTASWARGGLVHMDTPGYEGEVTVRDGDQRLLPSQRLGDGRLAVAVSNVPAFGTLRLNWSKRSTTIEGHAWAKADILQLGNDRLTITVDPQSGAIVSLRHRNIDGDLVQVGDDGNRGLNDYLYILGRDAEKQRSRGIEPVTATVIDAGPLVATLRITSTAPGCNLLTRDLTVVCGSDAIRIENTLDKQGQRQPEGVFLGFPLNVPNGEWRVDVPWAVVRPEADQLPGANRNYYCVQRWCNLANDQFGVTWVTLDANMMQFAPIRYTPAWGADPWRTSIEPGGTLYSWVCNNHWETNYKADQEGELRFRYELLVHDGSYDEAAVQRAARAVHQPLVAVPVNAVPVNAVPVNASIGNIPPAPAWNNDGVIATCFKPTRDGQARLLRLFNVTDAPQPVRLRVADSTGIWRSNPLEEKLEIAAGILNLDPHEILTLRIE